jgi:hypothetical protein
MSTQDNLGPQWYHGTPDERTFATGSARGIHVGTYEAARQALEARIGAPAEGDWDGTREYGKTPIVGNEKNMGYNTGLSCTDKGQPQHEHAKYSDSAPVPLDARPNIMSVQITGPMKEASSDTQANALIKRQITKGQAKTGYYYKNTAEDSGSTSAAVPSAAHLKRL